MDEGKLWSLIRNVLSQGGAIQLDRASMSGYEEYSARLDAAASDRVADFAQLSDARIAELELECSQWRDELRIYREAENARIAELEQAVAIRDTEIARLETDLELARRDHASALRLVTDIRFALGDNGKRMQPGFVEWCRELRADAERMNWLEASTFSPVTRAAIDVARDGHQGNSDDDR